MTTHYNEPSDGTKSGRDEKVLDRLIAGQIDVVAGTFPIKQSTNTYADFSATMLFSEQKYLVPCPKPFMKTEKILTIFNLSLWISMGLVFIFVSVLLWILSNYPTPRRYFNGFNMLAQSFSAAWAVLLGISVPQMPLSLGTRYLFITYVWYCFAISTVFQAFFTTYLVEPGYEARLETLDDVYRAGLTYALLGKPEANKNSANAKDMEIFGSETFTDIFEAIKSVMFTRSNFMSIGTLYPQYIARLSGFVDMTNVVCYLEESVVTWPMGVILTEGHPLLQKLNIHIKRCIEGGLLEREWSKIYHDTNLKANKTNENSEYVVFNLTHVSPVFMLLFVGYILSLFSFLCELVLFRRKNKLIDSVKFKQLNILADLRALEESK
ncbi:hypothetical protein L9F63_013895 [Diploptera punctata]|uniref:Ionotropic glutamate receptor C-terminal domain-containing protein n=1 Tax=Diploptera punctata TaxID=6984 RepID=A0AAD8A988_DIPPU|nr:hypothetical protein L9F63_013895 [Diploptera punctata]